MSKRRARLSLISQPHEHDRPEPAQKENLKERLRDIEQEARMILPGIQALFGFQLIAVFNTGFHTYLDPALHPGLHPNLKMMHFVALLCSAVAILLALAPAAYHRISEPGQVSTALVDLGGILLGVGMFPLCVGISLDVYLIGRVITESPTASACVALALFLSFTLLWFAFPILRRYRSDHAG